MDSQLIESSPPASATAMWAYMVENLPAAAAQLQRSIALATAAPSPAPSAPHPVPSASTAKPAALAPAKPAALAPAPANKSDSPMSPDMDIVHSSDADSDSDSFTTVTRRGKRPRPPASPTTDRENRAKAAKANSGSPRPQSPVNRTQVTEPRRPGTPPPIFVQDKSAWNKISAALTASKINFLHARATAAAIKVQVATADDHRALTKYLRDNHFGYHTYSLPEERVLRVVIRGLPKELATSDILADLVAQGYPARDIHRLYRRDRSPLDLTLVILDLTPEGKAIFQVKAICHISGIKIEVPHKRGMPGQCHNCQLYGHAARNCFARARCVKCLGDHATPDCPRPRIPDPASPPSCVLCGTQGHTANYRGCPRAPRKQTGPSPRNNRAPRPATATAIPATPLRPAYPMLPPSKPNPWFANNNNNKNTVAPVPFTVTAPAPAPGPAQPAPPAPRAPKATAAAPAPRPVISQNKFHNPSANVASDLELVLGFVEVIDLDEIALLASKLRAADGITAIITASTEHNQLIRNIKNLISRSQ
jgi:hypothetical protein